MDARERMPWDIEHLSPSVIWRVNGCYGRVDYAGQCAYPCCKLIAEARDRSWVRIVNTGYIDMPFEQMVLTDSEVLVVQEHNASNQQGCSHQKHQGHGHFRHDQEVANTLRGPTRGSGPPALFQCVHEVQASSGERRAHTKEQACG